MQPETLKERQAVAFVTTTTLNNTSISSSGINMGVGPTRLRAFLIIGSVTGGGSVNFSLQQSATSGGSYAAITGLTTLPAVTGIVTANSLNAIEISSDLLGTAGKPWVKAIATETGSQAVVATLIVIADDSRYKPAGTDYSVSTFTNNVVAFV